MLKKVTIRKKRVWIWGLIILVILAGGGAGYYYWTQTTKTAAASTKNTLNTAQVRRGSIILSASGSGTLIAAREAQISFSTSGKVATLNVQIGDQVKQGQVLAELDNKAVLQADLNTAQQNLISAQLSLKTFTQTASANLANAQLKLTTAKKALDDAKSGLVQKGMARCDQQSIDAYYSTYLQLKSKLDVMGDGNGDQNFYLYNVVPLKNQVAKAYSTYAYCAGFTDYEITSSQGKLALAQAQYDQAQTTLDTLQKNNGLDPVELAQAQNQVDNAQNTVNQAQETLDGATLKAPFDGTVLSVAGQVGDQAGTSAFITLADLVHPRIEFSVDETDMGKLSIGEKANITFDALPGKTFSGTVIRINPALETVNGYQVLKGLIELDLSKEKNTEMLRKGLNASVELIQGQTQSDALLIPIQALRDLGNGEYAVFVVGSGGQPRLRAVKVGLINTTFAEITEGLSANDTVSTGTSETK
jgi:RND family efflux transporter MFP subunit